MVKVVIFDLYGTIAEQGLENSPSKQVKKILGVKESFQEFITTFQQEFMTLRHNSLEDAFRVVANEFDIDADQETFDELVGVWNKNALLTHLYDDTEKVLKEVKETHTIILAANVSEFTYEQLEIKFSFKELFDDTYLSFETGNLKTSQENLDTILNDQGVTKDEVLYVGDSLKSDIYPCKEYGIDSLLIDRRETRDYQPKIVTLEDLQLFL